MQRTTQARHALAILLCAAGGALAAPGASTTTLAISQNPGAGQPYHLVATVTSGGKAVNPGFVKFCLVGAKLCEGPSLLGQVGLNGTGLASINRFLSPGQHSLKAVFVGTRQFAASNSTPQTVTVNGSPTSTAISAVQTPAGVMLTAAVAGFTAAPVTGNVTFWDKTNGNRTVGSAALTRGATQLSFGGLQLSSGGTEPLAIAAGDFNNDGFTDLAVINEISNTLEITSVSHSLQNSIQLKGRGPSALAVADFDLDGNLDIVVVFQDSSEVHLYKGNGDLTFTLSGLLPTGGTGPSGIVVADFNNDGFADIAITNQLSNNITVWLGGGPNQIFTLNMPPASPTGSFPHGLVAGDFDGDGNMDLATANYFTNDVTILLGKGDGSFRQSISPVAGVYPDSITSGDFNGDGKLDLAVSNQFSGTVTILIGNGDGTFTATPTAPAVGKAPGAVVVGDFNQDGIEDLAVPLGANSVSILLGKGDGNFSNFGAQTLSAGSAPHAAAIGDFGALGTTSIAVANSGINTVSVLFNTVESTATAMLSGVALTPGAHTIVASYPGVGNYGASSAQTGVLIPIPTTTALSVRTQFVPTGYVAYFTATVAPASFGNFAATGMVSFYNGTTLIRQAPVTNGTAQANILFHGPATEQLTARYSGDANFSASTSTLVMQVIPKI